MAVGYLTQRLRVPELLARQFLVSQVRAHLNQRPVFADDAAPDATRESAVNF